MTLEKLPRKVLAKIDLQMAFMASRCVIAAERFQLFRKLHGKELSLAAICKKTGIKNGWRAESFLAALVSLGLLTRKGNKYSNSALADKYYVRERSIHWTRLFSSHCQSEFEGFAVLEESLQTGRDPVSILGTKRRFYIQNMLENEEMASEFTRMLYYDHIPDAKALAKVLDLSGYRSLLDVGGGSGVMSMALVRKYKNLSATVLELEPVARVANKIVRKEGLSKRIKAITGDMTKPFPEGFDVMMFCDAGYGDPIVFENAFRALPKNGLIVLAEYFSSEDLTDPLFRLMWQLRSKKPWLVTRQQAVEMLEKSGFRAIKKRHLYKDVWLITAKKL